MEWAWFVSGLVCGYVICSVGASMFRRHRDGVDERKDLGAIIYSGLDSRGVYRPGLLEQLRVIENKVDSIAPRPDGDKK